MTTSVIYANNGYPRVTRPDWLAYNYGFAEQASKRASCPRAFVGAAAFRENNTILLTGYNGAPADHPQCDQIGCLMVEGHCIRAHHAEQNLIYAARQFKISLVGSSLFCTHKPCIICAGRIVDAGVATVYYRLDYGDHNLEEFLGDAGVAVHRLELI